MALVIDETHKAFDITQIHRGDCIRIRRVGDTTGRNGFVTEVTPDRVRLLYCNIQNNATSYLDIMAEDVALGVWEVYWTSDFQAVNYECNATATLSGGEMQ